MSLALYPSTRHPPLTELRDHFAIHVDASIYPPWTGMLIFDVVDDEIVYVEVLDRPPLD
jgi:hypothetical protein